MATGQLLSVAWLNLIPCVKDAIIWICLIHIKFRMKCVVASPLFS